MLPFVKIFLIPLISDWLMCEVCFALCKRVMDFSDLCENVSKLATLSNDFLLLSNKLTFSC